jgi:hypothetical protein
MGSDLAALFHSLGFDLDQEGVPRISPGIIQWIARINATSEVLIAGCDVGSEIWSTGSGFAPLDMAAFETWSYDLPAGNHLLIAERDISFNMDDLPIRAHRNVVIWTRDDLSRVVGQALLEGRLQIDTVDQDPEVEISLLNYRPRINTVTPDTNSPVDFSKLLSQRRSTPSTGGGELLRWWRIVPESLKVIEKPLTAPGRRGIDPQGGYWLLNLATGKLLRRQP